MTKKKNTEPWFCLNCGDDISHMRSDAKYCWKTECRNAYAVNKYSERLTEKICNYCGKSFLGKDKAVNCDN